MIDNDELDAWLYEVETTSQKVIKFTIKSIYLI